MKGLSGGWTAAKAAVAVAGALAIAGAVGSAVAVSPTVIPPIKWQGGAEFTGPAAGLGLTLVYTVPSGRNLVLTDLMIANSSAGTRSVTVYTGSGSCSNVRTTQVHVGPNSTYALSFQTGIGVGSGQSVCLSSSDGSYGYSGRGFLFTPS